MKKTVGIILTSSLLGLQGCSSTAVKPQTMDNDSVMNSSTELVAKVNGEPITEAAIKHLTIETAMYNRRLQVPRKQLIEELVDRELLYQEAIDKGFEKKPAVADQIKVASRSIVSKAYMRSLVNQIHVSRDEIKAEFQKRIKNHDLREFRISHILVDNEKQAQQVIAQLDQGRDFQQLAKTLSKDVTGKVGGVLGWRGAKQMEPEIAAAVTQLKTGEYTKKAVKTRYGWHIVRVDEVRELAPPSLDKQEHSLKSIIKRHKLKQYIENLKAKSNIKLFKQATDPVQPKKVRNQGEESRGRNQGVSQLDLYLRVRYTS